MNILIFASAMDKMINIKGRLLTLEEPQVMGILNVTPDSFYADSRMVTEEAIADRVRQIIAEGASIIDIGACSTRPGSEPVDAEEEMRRLRVGLSIIGREQPNAIVSVDTFRPEVARMAVEEYGADIINDVTGGCDEMYRMVSRLRVPYILTSVQPTLRELLMTFADQLQQLRNYGMKDVILDPGFGFGKTLEQNYALMDQLERLAILELPLLVGISRKSMIYRLLGVDPAEALNGTTALHMMALMKGAHILRVHDVKEAVECCRIYHAIKNQE